MSWGFNCTAPDGSQAFTTARDGYSFVDNIDVIAGGSGSRSYPSLAGWQLKCAVVQNASTGAVFTDIVNMSVVNVSVTYVSGYPVVSWVYGASVGVAQPVTIFVVAS